MKFKHWIAGLASLVVIGQASASVLTYSFTAVVNDLWEYDKASTLITRVSTSDFAGGAVSLGSVVHGQFSFNTDAPLGSYQPDAPTSGAYVLYALDSSVSSLSLSVGAVAFQSGSTLSASAQVADNASTFNGSDIFYFGAYKAYDPVMFQSADISLFDRTGAVFSSVSLPTQLDLNSFTYRQLGAAWLRQADGDQMHLSATITALNQVASVPEPASYALLMVGLVVVTGASRKLPHRRA